MKEKWVHNGSHLRTAAAGVSFFISLLALSILAGMSGREGIQEGIAEEIIRFHVIANSDTDKDQALKKKIRDDVDTYLEVNMPEFEERSQAEAYLGKEKGNLLKIAGDRITREGYAYPVRVELGDYYFPEKAFGPYVFPEGNYKALRMVIGEGGGHNWWGVMYPNLCFTQGSVREISSAEDKKLHSVLSEEEYQALLTAEPNQIKIKFKLPDFLAKLIGAGTSNQEDDADQEDQDNFEECLE